jgi:hypothetical protein
MENEFSNDDGELYMNICDNITADVVQINTVAETEPFPDSVINTLINRKKVTETIDLIYTKYQNNEYMLSKTYNYICNLLPNILNNIEKTHIERVNRMEELSNEQDEFIQSFLTKTQYFYVSATEKFFFYDGIHYHLINEDDIIYNVLSTITRDTHLMSWKQRTKINIMKRIRENSLLKSIPESETIQLIIDALYPTLFSTRTEAKYFLTIMGDNILRKHNNLIHFLSSKSKHFLQELNNICQMLIGYGFSHTFKHKYHEHEYADCRILKINECVKNESVWMPIINQYALDMICVACHYSIRYASADDYVYYSSNDDLLIHGVFYMKNTSPTELVQTFVREYLDINRNMELVGVLNLDGQVYRSTQITWKNMQYLWKQYLESKNLPTILFMQNLKTLLVENLDMYYKEDQDTFVGISSRFLPAIQKFLQFWNETMVPDETESDLEIEEVLVLFRKWNDAAPAMNDKQIIDLIIHFFPNVEIERDKYISKWRCVLWDKQLDIQIALAHLKETIREKYPQNAVGRSGTPQPNVNVSIYDAYLFYCKYFSNDDAVNKLKVSKSYFEKYVFENLEDYVIDSKFLSAAWYML